VSIKERINENRKRLAEQWKQRGFDPKKFRSSTVAPPPPEGFVRAYHFTCKKYGRAAIGDRRLKVALFSDANDPFELMAISSHTHKARQVLGSLKKDQDRLAYCASPKIGPSSCFGATTRTSIKASVSGSTLSKILLRK